tara:strand:- start:970 stop:1212 length:243 start_codon:yes stop_codon:yes gene_type:complete
MHNQEVPDLNLIKRQAKTRSKEAVGMTYMQCLDQVARELYGLRHFHEARAKAKHAANATPATASPLQYYLRTVQEYYLDF